MSDFVHHELGERVKELKALHRTARVLQQIGRPVDELMEEVVSGLPPAWQHPGETEARIVYGDRCWQTPDFVLTPWSLTSQFATQHGRGELSVVYLAEHERRDEGPFLREERDLIDSLAEMLRAHFEHRESDRALQRAHDDLERQVADRTAELRRLSAELCLAEARERRRIAEDLHDHIGQALAFIRTRLRVLQGNAVFCGFEGDLAEISRLLDQTIRYTRDLTFEISPPVLYELGLPEALDWLAETMGAKSELHVEFRTEGDPGELADETKVMLFNSARELLRNVARHAEVDRASMELARTGNGLRLGVSDRGCGIDAAAAGPGVGGFGLFSIRERMKQLGGSVEIDSVPGRGTTVELILPLDSAVSS